MLCAEKQAPRYERREQDPRRSGTWNPLRRRIAQVVRAIVSPTHRELA
jgi:hypothetical protein